jgi:hypothetical protein
MKIIRTLLVSMLVFANSVFANTTSTDMTDLWWNANESGWGVTVAHRGDIAFLTLFVYDASGKPKWYTGQTTFTGAASGVSIFSGPMYETSGPWFGTFFDPNTVGVRQVGTVTFAATVYSATLTYSVDGTAVSKTLMRMTLRNNDLTGDYAGILRSSAAGCASGTNSVFEETRAISITTSGSTFSMETVAGVLVCRYAGNYTQTGRMGRSQGTYTCRALRGTYDFEEIETSPGSISLRFTESNDNCSQITGRLVGIRK